VEPTVVPKREDLTIDVDALIEAANRTGVAAILFSNPCNPTSIVLPREEVLRLIRGVSCLVVVDEAYMDFSADESVRSEIGRCDNLIVLKTCSKALVALRCGSALPLRTSGSPLRSGRLSRPIM
jgi:histidinol-phosphate aminotransferase